MLILSCGHMSPVSLLRYLASSAAYQLDAVTFDAEDGGRYVSPIMTGLREQCAYWSTRILGETSAVGAQCFGSSDLQTPAIRPCF